MFLSLDTSHDGTLSVDEIKQGMATILGPLISGTNTGREYENLMLELDVNKDGVIDYTEFITAAIDKVAFLNRENLLACFRSIDKDNSGTITMDELQAAFDSHHSKDKSLWEDILVQVDKNKDGEISLDEFFEAMATYLKENHRKNSPKRLKDAGLKSDSYS